MESQAGKDQLGDGQAPWVSGINFPLQNMMADTHLGYTFCLLASSDTTSLCQPLSSWRDLE